ncbi:unnamed protein product [Camellia sinensis]
MTAMNKLLMEENDRLQKQVSQLVCENGFMRQQLHTALATTDASCESMVTTTQHSMRDANNPAGDSSAAKMAQSKLGENVKKLQKFSTAVAFEAEDVNQAVSAARKAFDQGPWKDHG